MMDGVCMWVNMDSVPGGNSSGWETSFTLLGGGDFFHRLHTRGVSKQCKTELSFPSR